MGMYIIPRSLAVINSGQEESWKDYLECTGQEEVSLASDSEHLSTDSRLLGSRPRIKSWWRFADGWLLFKFQYLAGGEETLEWRTNNRDDHKLHQTNINDLCFNKGFPVPTRCYKKWKDGIRLKYSKTKQQMRVDLVHRKVVRRLLKAGVIEETRAVCFNFIFIFKYDQVRANFQLFL